MCVGLCHNFQMFQLVFPTKLCLPWTNLSLFPVQLTIEGVPTMLDLEASSNFMAIGWGIQVFEINELESSDKEHVRNQETHIIKTSKIECHPKDVKTYVDMVDANTSKQISTMNLHVSEVTRQVLRIVNSVLEV